MDKALNHTADKRGTISAMRVDVSTDPGGPTRTNEDFAAVTLSDAGGSGALVILDGVTPPQQDVGCRHGVAWFVGRLGAALLDRCTGRLELTLPEALAAAVEQTADRHRASCDLDHPRTPQATVVCVRWSAERVEYLVLSDSVLLLDRGIDVSVVLDDRLRRLPKSIAERRRQVRDLPPGSPERAAAMARLSAAVESLRNVEGGFHTAAADPSVAARAVTGVLPRADVRGVVALTDGASRLVEVFREMDWAGLFKLLRKQGTEELIKRVRTAEHADPRGEAFPRGKIHDDATAVLVDLKGVP